MKYSLKTGLLKVVKYVAMFGIPMVVTMFLQNNPSCNSLTIGQCIDAVLKPILPSLTIGGLLVFAVNFIKVWGSKIDG